MGFVNSQTSLLGAHRVILYPQAFFASPKSQAVCFRDKAEDVVGPLFAKLANATECPDSAAQFSSKAGGAPARPTNAAEHPPLGPEQCRELRALFYSDVLLWGRSCEAPGARPGHG